MKKVLLSLLILLFFFACKKRSVTLTKITAETMPINHSIASDNNYIEVIAPYKERVIKEINRTISYTPKNLTRDDGDLESSLGNLLADLCYKRANPVFKKKTGRDIDFSMFNYGGIRPSIPKGNVTNKHAFELMPYENNLVVVELSGEKIMELIAFFIENQKAHPLSKHIDLTISDNGYQLNINNKPFYENNNYFVLTSDYLQKGDSQMNFFKNPVNLYKIDYKMRHAIIDGFKDLDTVKTNINLRVKRK